VRAISSTSITYKNRQNAEERPSGALFIWRIFSSPAGPCRPCRPRPRWSRRRTIPAIHGLPTTTSFWLTVRRMVVPFCAKPGYRSVNLPRGGGPSETEGMSGCRSAELFRIHLPIRGKPQRRPAGDRARPALWRCRPASAALESLPPGPIGIVTIREGKAP
jgi:hypothetical protein